MTRKLMSFYLSALVLAGCQAPSPSEALSIKPAWNHKMAGLTHYSLADGENIWVQNSPIVTMADVKEAWYVKDDLGRGAVMVKFDAAGTARISRFSSGHDKQPLAVFVDYSLVSAPLVTGTIGSEFMIQGIGDKAYCDEFITRSRKFASSRR